ncbi:prepilin-type N-terminal cleavage/methylation domain-containing protein [Shimwellia pseudoproteus]|uniref:prepilin-type N-terminal cleavage/methylation domain-containing protein n=1 Tax=Shimwellia pseudoproteus TaxID=570012 RepID=UPI001E3E3B10|nr:prepilin-type N-terminal cleavage/methylation domain-containing protein [Shimwellia pseudoproteus]
MTTKPQTEKPQTAAQQGYSLVELVIVMLIIMLTAAGGHRWYQWQGRQQLRHSALALRDYLQQQRDRANGFNRDITIRQQQTSDGWCLVAGTHREQTGCPAAAGAGYRPLAADITLVSLTPGLTFYGLRNTAWPGHVVLANRAG